ncbi:Cnl1p PWA37_001525 [Arxiozyma heterogenica]|uniref:Cnl1p n=1 Tax=Arxiozyma heterogenica TaxID=278026 RepID=UPI002EDEDBD5
MGQKEDIPQEEVVTEEEPGNDSQKIDQDVNDLGINRLILDYDYLLYKINDYVQSIQLRTNLLCMEQNRLIEADIIDGLINANIDHLKYILEKCDELETHFDMMDQIDQIVQSFKDRLQSIRSEYNQLKKNEKIK